MVITETAPPSPTMPMANPRRRWNHSPTSQVAESVTAPWPMLRIMVNPIESSDRLLIDDIQTQAVPSNTPSIGNSTRAPTRSSSQPIAGNSTPPTRPAMR